ncbi:MAG TPA: SpoIID/LytB domain-containing protein [Candidatus Goldiibacteriota bacterium]|nr:SpoIID/LytB domain-containing protein [Candidatus Goldiibacteriota bacterium]
MKKAAVLLPVLFGVLLYDAYASDNPYYSDKTENAIRYYEESVQRPDCSKAALFNLASVYKEFGENRKAFEAYRKVLEINPKEPRAHFELAKAYFFLGAFNYAEEEINFFLRSGTANWEVYFWQANILMEMGKYAEAYEAFKKSIELDPRKAMVYVRLADMRALEGKYEEAIEAYRQAIKSDKTYTEEIIRKIAYLQEKKGDLAAAFSSWRQAGEIDTKDPVAAEKVQSFMAVLPDINEKNEDYKRQKKSQRDAYMPPDRNGPEDSENIPDIEVAIKRDVGYIYIKSGSDFIVFDDREQPLAECEAGREYYIEADKNGKKAYFGAVDGSAPVIEFRKKVHMVKKRREATTAVYNVRYGEGFYWSGQEDTTYRGDFKAILQDKMLTFINVLNVEEYLYGVLPSEMPADWSIEALKAQAVAARTYTFRHLRRHSSKGFDLCAQQHCAVYKGLHGETEKTNKAVDATRGEVLYGSNYQMLDTFYSHCCGGHTTDVNDAWGVRKVKSLGGVYDWKKQALKREWEFPLEPFYLEEWVRTVPDAYCKASGSNEISYRWIRYLDAESLRYYVNKRFKIGRIKDLKPLKRAGSGALTRLQIEGENGVEIVGFDAMRNILGKIRANVIKWEYSRDENGYIKQIYIYGAGWGHSIGMCQRGAKGMAEKGKAYNEILYHYFPGSYLKKKY